MGAFRFLSFAVTLNIIFLSWANSHTVCPNICSCKWKSGKQTAECVGQELSSIPSGLNIATQVIDLSQNNFETIPSRIFQQKGLVNLQKIFFAESAISSVASDAFFQLSNLIELDFTGNELSEIPSDTLRDCPHLRRLQLAQNPIKYVPENSFAPLSHLTFLDLSSCEIEDIEKGAFNGLMKMEFLKLDGNQLITLSVDVLESLTQLTSLHLHNNPWNCDCRIRNVREWMVEQNIPLAIPPRCEFPKHSHGITWDDMSLDDFACIPDVYSSRANEMSVILGQNASIECRVDSTPKSSVYWEVGGRILVNVSYNPEYRDKYSIDMEGVLNTESQSSRLTIFNVDETDADVYICIAENKAGNSSINFTVSVVSPYPQDGSWGTTQITLVTVSLLLAILIALAIITALVFHPTALSTDAKVGGVDVFKHFRKKKTDSVEMNAIGVEKEEKEFKVTEKQPRQETGSSGYGSDQLTPDLVSKIMDTNHGPSLSTSTVTCSHPEFDNSSLNEGYGPISDPWSDGRAKPPRYDDSPGRSVYSEIYPNPCFGRDDSDCFMMSSPTILHHPEFHAERYIPQNDRVRTLRAGIECSGSVVNLDGARDETSANGTWKRSTLVVSNNVSHYTLPNKARFSPDEGYAEEALEGTEV